MLYFIKHRRWCLAECLSFSLMIHLFIYHGWVNNDRMCELFLSQSWWSMSTAVCICCLYNSVFILSPLLIFVCDKLNLVCIMSRSEYWSIIERKYSLQYNLGLFLDLQECVAWHLIFLPPFLYLYVFLFVFCTKCTYIVAYFISMYTWDAYKNKTLVVWIWQWLFLWVSSLHQ